MQGGTGRDGGKPEEGVLTAAKESWLIWACLLGVCFSAFAAYGSLGKPGSWTAFTIWVVVANVFALVAFLLGRSRKPR
jgi:hypothetical protein